MLRPFLNLVHDDPQTGALARDGGRAFVASSLRPYVVAALADEVFAASKPALVVAGDDRQARDLAHDLEAWLAPRPVRFYPSRGVAYESHLAPPPHLVGLRVAAIDALLSPEGEPPVVVVSAAALSEKVPDPALRPASFVLRKGDLLDLDETASQLVAAFLDLAPDAAVLVAADEDVSPALHDHWSDVCAAFHDTDAHGLYVTPEAIESALDERARVRLGTISGDQPFAFRAQASDFA